MATTIIHCSYHKCLTVYYQKIFSTLYNRVLRHTSGYKHFNSLLDEFYAELPQLKAASVNNHSINLINLGEATRITRFIRDPRDLIVSGYHYHKRGAEPWCNIVNPSIDDWRVVNGNIPKNMGTTHSYSSYLQSIDIEDGLLAEIEFRKNHFSSMLQWPVNDERIKLFRYEDIIGQEKDVIDEMFIHYKASWIERRLSRFLAQHYSASNQKNKTAHIRNPKSGQWNEVFTPKVEKTMEDLYSEVMERYGYA
ncbi:MAG: sulfotransferase domain-containing protein [Immundisolibacteraceae bacterium]|nr:sulfotransferase domain-containing protein [Immundisolibacteraceae bacterium]